MFDFSKGLGLEKGRDETMSVKIEDHAESRLPGSAKLNGKKLLKLSVVLNGLT